MSKNRSAESTAESLSNFRSLWNGSSALSFSLKGLLTAPNQKVFSSAMYGNRRSDFAQ